MLLITSYPATCQSVSFIIVEEQQLVCLTAPILLNLGFLTISISGYISQIDNLIYQEVRHSALTKMRGHAARGVSLHVTSWGIFAVFFSRKQNKKQKKKLCFPEACFHSDCVAAIKVTLTV